MTTKQALEDLRDKVKEGAERIAPEVIVAFGVRGKRHEIAALNAHHGYIDSAKALHEALLPDWHFSVATEGDGKGFYASVSPKEWDRSFTTAADTPARAWLLAILEALIEKEEK